MARQTSEKNNPVSDRGNAGGKKKWNRELKEQLVYLH